MPLSNKVKDLLLSSLGSPEARNELVTAIEAVSSNGEVNTASNVGSGSGVFKQKTGVDLEFKSLVAGTNITLTPTATGITIDAAAPAAGANTTLSNLVYPVLANQSLIPGNGSVTLGIVGGAWNSIYVQTAKHALDGFITVDFNNRLLVDTSNAPVSQWLNGYLEMLTGHAIRFGGATSGYVSMAAPNTVTSYNLILPDIQGGASTFLQNDGSGALSWASFSGAAADLSNLSNPTSINQNLIPNGIFNDLGNLENPWFNLWVSKLKSASSNNVAIDVSSRNLISSDGFTPLFSWSGTNAELPPGTSLQFSGLTSGSVSFKAPNTVTSYNLILPDIQGGIGSALQNDGSGNLSWTTGASGSFTTVDLKTVTVVNGLITSIV